ncbi:hypothetical protein KEM52_002023 [Ascosphaera acerosa]|nr:hypothetical protein KEM52_002023 [Ascosphaera acerosa]
MAFSPTTASASNTANLPLDAAPPSRHASSPFSFLRRQRSTETMPRNSTSSRKFRKAAAAAAAASSPPAATTETTSPAPAASPASLSAREPAAAPASTPAPGIGHRHDLRLSPQPQGATPVASPIPPKPPMIPRLEQLSSSGSGEEIKSEVTSIFSALTSGMSPATQHDSSGPSAKLACSQSHTSAGSSQDASPPLASCSPAGSHKSGDDSGNNVTNRSRYSYGTGPPPGRGAKRVRRRREPTPFNILILGSKNSGKTSFANFLRLSFERSGFAPLPQSQLPRDLAPSTANAGFEPTYIEGKIEGEFVGITIWDSEAIEKSLIDIQLDAITRFLEDKFEDTFTEEMKVVRQPHSRDTHIHCAFLLLDPVRLDHSIKASADKAKRGGKAALMQTPRILDEDVDLRTLATVASRTTVVPLISKADTVTAVHMTQLKKAVADCFKAAGLDPLEQLMDIEEEANLSNEDSDKDDAEDNADVPILPMSVFSPDEETMPPAFTSPVGRYFPWGFADPHNTQHCDFQKVKEIVFEDWLADMRVISHDVWYEKWRTHRLNLSRRPRTRV